MNTDQIERRRIYEAKMSGGKMAPLHADDEIVGSGFLFTNLDTDREVFIKHAQILRRIVREIENLREWRNRDQTTDQD
jgi:hypothetical protein